MQSAQLVRRVLSSVLMTSTLFVIAEQTQAYGPGGESCTTQGIQINVGEDISPIISAGAPDDTFLLRRGVHKLDEDLYMPKGTANRPITIKPYNCENVTLETNGNSIKPNDYSIIAGLVLASVGSRRSATIIADETSSDPRTNIIIRNNEFNGGAAASQIRLRGNIKDAVISGNEIQHAKGKLITLRLVNAGSMRPHNILIEDNKFSNCGEDCFQPQSAGTFILRNNDFIGPADENLVDVKGVQEDAFILKNNFECENSQQTCVMLHGDHARGATVIIEDNLFLDCPKSRQAQLRLIGNDDTYLVRNNIFDSSILCRAIIRDS